ncbi:MAG: ferritin-like domain-containing protein [Actinobacteria bacterium]|nr:ferritin-like domain-containing protein [Actinomycetota bacterium]
MKRMLTVDDLARDERFERIRIEEVVFDPRRAHLGKRENAFKQSDPDSPDAARALMHGIFVGEIQALEGAGRTCYDFEDEAPFALKLDMARQAWDEARHVEISVKLTEHMGSEIGEFSEQTLLFEAACNEDPVLRLTGVNRALEGLAIDVFNTMRDFGAETGDPVLHFCEDWMLADEVTHVKMGSDWLRKLTENDPERRKQAFEFQRTVDKLFSFGGFRGESEDNPIHLARRFRSMAGFSEDEIADLVDIAADAQREAEAKFAAAGTAATD